MAPPKAILSPAAKKAAIANFVLIPGFEPSTSTGNNPIDTRPHGQAMSTYDIRPVRKAGILHVITKTTSCKTALNVAT